MRTVQEEDELLQSHETLNEQQLQQKPNSRKVSLMSEDSDIFIADKMFGVGSNVGGTMTVGGGGSVQTTATKPPYLNIQTRQETTSTESKDTLTPIEANEVGMGGEAEDEDGSIENIMELNFETARSNAKAMRRLSQSGRRLSSECCSNYDLNRSQTSLNAAIAMSRRQLSLTQSEPDSGNELTGMICTFSVNQYKPANCHSENN